MTIDSTSPQYVRFARALALVTTVALPACGSAADPSPGADPHVASPAPSETVPTVAIDPAPSASAPAPAVPLAEDTPHAPAAVPTDAATLDDAATVVAISEDAAVVAPVNAGVDAAPPHPHTSGPLAPPELPVEMA
jgi:hypothetical protein